MGNVNSEREIGAGRQGPAVLIDFAPRAGLQEVSLSPQDLAARSVVALDGAMSAIREMAEKISAATRDLARRPGEVEVEFGLQLTAMGNAMIARAQADAHIRVTLRWSKADE